MSLLDLFRGRKRDVQTQTFEIARNEAGDAIYSEDIVAEILGELERRRSDRAPYELQWTLNADFVAGHQNAEIDTVQNCIRTENPFGPDSIDERRVYNRIAPLMDTRLANLMSVQYHMFVKPRTNEMEDAEKAKIGTKLLEYCQSATDFPDQINQLLQWAEICGTAFTVSWWDKNRGDVIAEMQVEAEGQESRRIPVRLGDVSFGLLSPYEVFPESLTVQNVEDQHDIIVEQVFDVDTVRDVWGLDLKGETCETYVITPESNAESGHGHSHSTMGVSRAQRDGCARVVTYYERPTTRHERGRMIVIIGDRIVFYGDLPAGVMPIVVFKSKEKPGLFFGTSPVEALIPLQRSYNELQNKIMDYAHAVTNAPMKSPIGALDLDEIERNGGVRTGDIIEYDQQYGEPHYFEVPGFPAEIIGQRNQLAQDMEYTAGVSQLMVYGAAANSASGKALDTRREIDMTRMSLTADNIRNAVIEMARIWLKLNKAYSVGYRTMLIAGDDDMGGIWTWCADDINSYDVEYEADNELRYSADQQREDFLQAFQLGLFADERGLVPEEIKRRAWEMFRAGKLADVTDIKDQQRKNAQREVVYFQNGVLPEEDKYADDDIHVEEHIRFALSNDYRLLKKRSPHWAAVFDQHIDEHMRKIAQREQKKQAQAAQMQQLSQAPRGGASS